MTVASFPRDCEKSHRSEAEPRNFPCLRVKRDQRFDYELMICNGTKCIRTTNPDYLQMSNDRDWIGLDVFQVNKVHGGGLPCFLSFDGVN